MYPSRQDWEWIPDLTNFNEYNKSYIYLGGIDPYVYDQELSNQNVATILVSQNQTSWVFDTQTFSFGDDTDFLKQFNLAGTYTTMFEIGFNGIGIPGPKWLYWYRFLNETIWVNSDGVF